MSRCLGNARTRGNAFIALGKTSQTASSVNLSFLRTSFVFVYLLVEILFLHRATLWLENSFTTLG